MAERVVWRSYQRVSVAFDSSGNFVVVRPERGSGRLERRVFGQRYGRIVPVELMYVRVE